jgi:glutamine synthetase
MDIARKVALRHHFICVFHEKPFDGLNGSGKHSNWSLVTDHGDNLLEPGRTPHQNLRFLAFMAVCLKAVHDHADLLRTSIANANNDLRLGANEAPPAIISVFVGDLMTRIIERIVEGAQGADAEHFVVDIGVGKLPKLARDYTDRNRTSPFAFTGNKFEFRAVGSSMNTAAPMAVLLAAVADAMAQMTKRLEAKTGTARGRDEAVLELLREVFRETAPVRFEGNGYSEEWKLEAGRRGLPNLPDTPAALEVLRDPKRTAFLRDMGVFSERELASRHVVALERYIKQATLEAETLMEMLSTYVIPAGEKQLAESAAALAGLDAIPAAARALEGRIKTIGTALGDVIGGLDRIQKILSEAESTHDERACARRLADDLRPTMAAVREAADRLEHLVDDGLWELPKYREMLFVK